MRRYYGKIELGLIAVLLLLLSLNFGEKSKPAAYVLAAEHTASEYTQNGYVLDGNLLQESTQTAVPEEEAKDEEEEKEDITSSLEEDMFAGYEEEVVLAYQEATALTIPEGLAFANVEESLSVREWPDGESRQIGIMYPNNACTVHAVEGEWAQITTGDVSGYCRVKYLIQGEEAAQLAKQLVVRTAKTTANVNLRTSPTTQANNILRTATPGESFLVLTPAILTDDPQAPLFVEAKEGEQIVYIAIGKVALTCSWETGIAK